jgi:hypothetical protein
MRRQLLVAVKCRLSKGMFSSERAFTITLANGEQYSGPAPVHFCWNSQKLPLREDEASETAEVDGYVAARILPDADVPPGQVAVEVPDGEALAVRADLLLENRPTPVTVPSVTKA